MQIEAGAVCLDLSVGGAVIDEVEAMRWLVETALEISDTPVAIDSRKMNVIEAGLRAIGSRPGCIINARVGDTEQLAQYMTLALEDEASLVAVTMDAEGLPRNAEQRVEIAGRIIDKAMEIGLPPDRLFIDPVVMPVNQFGGQDQPRFAIEAMDRIRLMTYPPVHLICGLSNVSQGARERPLINRTFLAMAVAAGLDAAIIDVTDTALMETWAAAEILLNQQTYVDSFLKAARMMTVNQRAER